MYGGGGSDPGCRSATLWRVKRVEKIADLEDRLERLRERNRRAEAQLKARKARLESAERARDRRLRTRRLILMGSYMEHIADRDPEAQERLRRGLDGFLLRDRDRELFELAPKEAS